MLSEKEPNDTLPVLDLELTRGGSVVWIRALVNPAGQRFEVVRWDGAAASMLDSGPLEDIQAASLAISDGRAYWFAHGQAMAAIVDPAWCVVEANPGVRLPLLRSLACRAA